MNHFIHKYVIKLHYIYDPTGGLPCLFSNKKTLLFMKVQYVRNMLNIY